MPEPFRRCHWLRCNRASKRPSALLFFDTEAYIDEPEERRQEHSFRLAVAAFCTYSALDGLVERERRVLASPLELWAWVETLVLAYPELTLIAHNIDYDARISGAFRYLAQNGWTPTWFALARSCTMFVFERDGCKVTLLDGLNVLPMALADLGASLGIPKGQVDFADVDDRTLAEYCANDVRILVEAWRRWFDFLDKNDMGDFGITIASQAWNAYRHRFMPTKIGIHNSTEAIELERQAYRGGRVETFFVGQLPQGTYYKLDVNGLYASLMDAHLYPRRLVNVVACVSNAYLSRLLEEYLCIAEVVLDTEQSRYPVRLAGRTAYPVGQFATTLTTPELKTALRLHHLVGIGRVALYEPAGLFSDYAQVMADLRGQYQEQGDYASDRMAKLLLNSLQGKFGQRGHKQKQVGTAPIDEVGMYREWEYGTDEEAVYWKFGGVIIRQWTEGESFDSFPAIPAHVTAYGRDHMQSLIERAGRRNVYYSDTDSLIVNQAGYDRLADQIFDDVPGMLKVEGTATDVVIRARKDYVFSGQEVVKGIRKDAKRLDDNVYEQWHFTTLRYAFVSRRLEGVTLHKVRKELRRVPIAGTIGRDGWILPSRVTMNVGDLSKLEPHDKSGHRWTWRVDPDFVEKISEGESRRRSLRVWVKWLRKPELPGPLPSRPPEPLSAPQVAASIPF